MKANTFYRRKLHNLEHFQYAATVLKMAQEANVEKLTATLPPLSAAVTAEDEVNNAQRKVNDSDELKALHKERERAFRSLTTKIEDAKLSDEKAEEAAGKRLDLILKRYPKPSKNNYDKESARLSNLITDFKSVEATPDATKLGLAKAITRVETTNKAFVDAYYVHFKKQSTLEKRNVRELRKVTDEAIDKVLWRAQGVYESEETEALATFIQLYNAYIADKQKMIERRENANLAESGQKEKEQRALLESMFEALSKELSVAAEKLHYTGKNVGSRNTKCYELKIDDREKTIWVKISRNKLVVVPESELPKPKNNGSSRHNTNDDNKPQSGNHGEVEITPKA